MKDRVHHDQDTVLSEPVVAHDRLLRIRNKKVLQNLQSLPREVDTYQTTLIVAVLLPEQGNSAWLSEKQAGKSHLTPPGNSQMIMSSRSLCMVQNKMGKTTGGNFETFCILKIFPVYWSMKYKKAAIGYTRYRPKYEKVTS